MKKPLILLLALCLLGIGLGFMVGAVAPSARAGTGVAHRHPEGGLLCFSCEEKRLQRPIVKRKQLLIQYRHMAPNRYRLFRRYAPLKSR